MHIQDWQKTQKVEWLSFLYVQMCIVKGKNGEIKEEN